MFLAFTLFVPLFLGFGGLVLGTPFWLVLGSWLESGHSWFRAVGGGLLALAGFVLTVGGGVLVPSLWERFRVPVLAGFLPGWGVAAIADASGPEAHLAALGSVCVPVVGLVMWPALKPGKEEDGSAVGGFRYTGGVVLLWMGLTMLVWGVAAAVLGEWRKPWSF